MYIEFEQDEFDLTDKYKVGESIWEEEISSETNLRRGYQTIYALHPDEEIAEEIFLESFDKLKAYLKGRKPERNKLVLSGSDAFLLVLLNYSEFWELDQECPKPKKYPRYQPNKWDFLLRYIKKIYTESLNRKAIYAAIGLGTLLYRYKTAEIIELVSIYDDDNSRRVKRWHRRKLGSRFPTTNLENIVLPNEEEYKFVCKSLEQFAPWINTDDYLSFSNNLIDSLFSDDSKANEWDRVRSILIPEIGGIPKLVTQYNEYASQINYKILDDPEKKIMIPNKNGKYFNNDDGQDPKDPEDRFTPQPLNESSIRLIKRIITNNEQRRNNFLGNRLSVVIDDRVVKEIELEELSNYQGDFSVTSENKFFEIYGFDKTGEILLASVPLFLESGSNEYLYLFQNLEIKITLTFGLIEYQSDFKDNYSSTTSIEINIKELELSKPIPLPKINTPPKLELIESSDNAVYEILSNTKTDERHLDEIKPFINYQSESPKTLNQNNPLAIFMDDPPIIGANIKVIGVGGAGGNALNRMIDAGICGVEFVAVNTDVQALNYCKAPVKIQIGNKLTRGLGAGADPNIGRDAALEDHEKILDILEGSDMVFITAGLGGGTGTGAAPIIGSLAIELGALTVAIVTKPFTVEGKKRMKQAEQGLTELRNCVDTIITIPNSKLKEIEEQISIQTAFQRADEVLLQAVQGISNLITVPGLINLDFADVKSVMKGMGLALLGVGEANGENSAIKAVKAAIDSRLLEENSIKGAKAALVNVTCSQNIPLVEIEEALSLVYEAADENSNIIFGTVWDESLDDKVKITIVATGFDRELTLPTANPNYKIPTITKFQPTRPFQQSQSTEIEEDFEIPTFVRNRKTSGRLD